MKIDFSSLFRQYLKSASQHYEDISPRLCEDFEARVKTAIRTISSWNEGDHVGPHGFPCRRCRPFPHLL